MQAFRSRLVFLCTLVGTLRNVCPRDAKAMHEAEIQAALSALGSIGVDIDGLCHSGLAEYDDVIPRCAAKRRRLQSEEGEEQSRDVWLLARNGLMAAVCVSTAALAAGLTVGLLSLEVIDLRIKEIAGATKRERAQAKSLIPLVQKHHRLLVTLLLMNSIANEALPLFLDQIVPNYVAVILSVTLVLFFGEIIPSAIFSGPDKVARASTLAPMVRTVMFLLAPLAIPLGKLLDTLLHDDHELDTTMSKYNRTELSALVRIQYEERLAAKKQRKRQMAAVTGSLANSQRSGTSTTQPLHFEAHENHQSQWNSAVQASAKEGTSTGGPTTDYPHHLQRSPSMHIDEVNMVEGALNMQTKRVMDVMTPWKKVYSVSMDMELNHENVVEIYRQGHSRVPIYASQSDFEGADGATLKNAICGILLTKQLIVLNPEEGRPVATLPYQKPFCVSLTMNLIDLMNLLQAGRSHMAIVCVNPDVAYVALNDDKPIPENAGVTGIVTLEDVFEELIQEEIYDEMDKKEKIALQRAAWSFGKWRLFAMKKRKEKLQTVVQQATDVAVKSRRAVDAVAALLQSQRGQINAHERSALLAVIEGHGDEGQIPDLTYGSSQDQC